MSLDIVEKLFRTMGCVFPLAELRSSLTGFALRPRVILVEQYGSLKGLVTVKDVLRFNAMSEAAGNDTLDSEATLWDSGALTGALEDVWLGVQQTWQDVVAWTVRGSRR